MDDFDVRGVVVEGARRVLVWDTLAHPDQMRPVAERLAGRAVTVAYSHADWDHVWGTAALGACDEVIAHRTCGDRFRQEVPDDLSARQAAEPGTWDAVRVVPPSRLFDEESVVDLGGVAVHLSHLPGHTVDCTVAWIPAWGVLLAGDTVETPLPVVNDGGAVAGWVGLLKGWRERPELGLVVPAHGRIGGPEVIDSSVDYLEALLAGDTGDPPPTQDPFYLRTHRENVRLTGG